MADKRIIELEERLTLEENDYLASDNTNGTCKVNAGIITNQFSDMQNKLGAKNLLKNGLTSRTTSGLTITVNSNGSILINGTAAADVSLTLVQNFTLAAGEYILSGVGSDAPGIGLSLNASYGGNTVTCNKDNTQKHFTLSSDSNITNVNMSITAGLAFTNYTLYPMIRPASVADEAFVAFEKTNAQLTKELGDPSTASAVSGSDAFGKIASLNNDLNNASYKFKYIGYGIGATASAPYLVPYDGYINMSSASGTALLLYAIAAPNSSDKFILDQTNGTRSSTFVRKGMYVYQEVSGTGAVDLRFNALEKQ